MPGYVRARGKRADGSTKWQARYWDPADQSRRIEKVFRTKREAEQWMTRQSASALDGTHIDPRRGERLVREVADAWRETWTDLEPKTRAGYEAILRKHVLPRFGAARIGAVSPEAVQRFVNELAAHRKPNTVRRVYTVLRCVFRVGVERRYLAINPCDAVKLPKKGAAGAARRQLYLSPQEVRALADAMPEHWQLPVYVAAYCGLRAGELWALRRRDVDPLHGTLAVERALKEINSSAASMAADKGLIFGPTKTNQTRKLTLPSFLRTMLAEHVAATAGAPDDLLFPSPSGKPVRHNLFYKRVFKPAVRASLPEHLHPLRWHDLRHTCAALSLAVAPNLHVVKERLGHDDIRTTVNIYGHLLPSVDAALADGLDGLYGESDAGNVRPLRAVE